MEDKSITYGELFNPELIEEELIKTKKKLDLFENLFAEPGFYNMDHYKKNLLRFQYESLNNFYMYLTSQYFLEQDMDVFEMYSSGYITKYGQTKVSEQEKDRKVEVSDKNTKQSTSIKYDNTLEEKIDNLTQFLVKETPKHYGNYRNG